MSHERPGIPTNERWCRLNVPQLLRPVNPQKIEPRAIEKKQRILPRAMESPSPPLETRRPAKVQDVIINDNQPQDIHIWFNLCAKRRKNDKA